MARMSRCVWEREREREKKRGRLRERKTEEETQTDTDTYTPTHSDTRGGIGIWGQRLRPSNMPRASDPRPTRHALAMEEDESRGAGGRRCPPPSQMSSRLGSRSTPPHSSLGSGAVQVRLLTCSSGPCTLVSCRQGFSGLLLGAASVHAAACSLRFAASPRLPAHPDSVRT